jgi:hypothetical protein
VTPEIPRFVALGGRIENDAGSHGEWFPAFARASRGKLEVAALFL